MPKKKPTQAVEDTKDKKKDAKSAVLDTVIKDFDSSWEYTKGSLHDRWSNNYKLYNNERVKRNYEGITDTFVPMCFSTVETLTSALFGSKPKFNYMAPRNKPDQKTDILNSLVDYYWDRDQWSIKVINTGRGGLTNGVGVDYFAWNGDHPVMINVPLRDFFIDPTATTLENARYMGRRYLISLDELKSFEIVDPETGDMKPKYKDLDKIEDPTDKTKHATGTTGDKTDKQEKDMFYGSTLNAESGQVEVIEYWTEDYVYSVANRSVCIEEEENYFKAKARANGDEFPEGLMPFSAFRDYVDASLFYAKGEIDFIADEQELLNDITNQNIDSITYTLNQMYTLDPDYGDQIETVENLPGAVYPFRPGALQPIPMGNIPQDAFNERLNIKNEIRETTASNEVVKGGSMEGGAVTATEINAQIAGAGQRINLKITQIENEYFHRMARIVFAMVRLYVTEPMMVRIVGKDGARWEEFDPSEYSDGEYEPRPQLEIAIQNKKAEDAAKAKEMMAAFLNDEDVNQIWLKKKVLSIGFELEPDELEGAFEPNPAPMGAGMPPMDDPMMGEMPPIEGEIMPPMDEEMMMPPMEEPPIAPPEIIIDPETGQEFVIDPATGEAVPLEALV